MRGLMWKNAKKDSLILFLCMFFIMFVRQRKNNIILSQNIGCVLNLNSNFCVKTVIYETGEVNRLHRFFLLNKYDFPNSSLYCQFCVCLMHAMHKIYKQPQKVPELRRSSSLLKWRSLTNCWRWSTNSAGLPMMDNRRCYYSLLSGKGIIR